MLRRMKREDSKNPAWPKHTPQFLDGWQAPRRKPLEVLAEDHGIERLTSPLAKGAEQDTNGPALALYVQRLVR